MESTTGAGLVQFVRRCLSGSPGRWIYRHEIASWIYDPETRDSLPWPYRVFARYGALQRRIAKSGRKIRGGEALMRSAILLSRALRLPSSAAVEIGGWVVFLDLHDPRMLQVPSEVMRLAGGSGPLPELLNEGDTFIDIGANHGSFSIVAAELVGTSGRVVAVEPQPRLAGLVRQSLTANAPCKFEVHAVACGEREDEVSFFVPLASSGASGVFPDFSARVFNRELTVPLRRFDDLVDWRAFSGEILIKLDVEGSELAFLRGAEQMLRARRPVIMMEVNPDTMRAAGVTRELLLSELLALGYGKFASIMEPHRRVELSSLDTFRQVNVLLFPAAA